MRNEACTGRTLKAISDTRYTRGLRLLHPPLHSTILDFFFLDNDSM